jgi:cyclopropane fatty-acyl-phospholipid synthase-like methyltransferase
MVNPYDLIAEQWNSTRNKLGSHEQKFLDLILESLPSNSTVLDLGCGTGKPMDMLVHEAGHKIFGIDRSSKLLEIAKKNLPDSEFLLADLETVVLEGEYDAAICWDALFHIERKHHEPILKKIAAALRANSRLILTAGGSENPPFTDKMFGEEFFYDSFSPDETIKLVENAGFQIITSEIIDIPDGKKDKGRIAIAAIKVL